MIGIDCSLVNPETLRLATPHVAEYVAAARVGHTDAIGVAAISGHLTGGAPYYGSSMESAGGRDL